MHNTTILPLERPPFQGESALLGMGNGEKGTGYFLSGAWRSGMFMWPLRGAGCGRCAAMQSGVEPPHSKGGLLTSDL